VVHDKAADAEAAALQVAYPVAQVVEQDPVAELKKYPELHVNAANVKDAVHAEPVNTVDESPVKGLHKLQVNPTTK